MDRGGFEGGRGMSELKTLKDIKLSYDYDTDCNLKEELKAEAVKHIKRFESSPYCGAYIGEINWIKYFFNLTGEDFK